MGGTEDSLVVETLQNAGFKLVATRGAGYKLLTVVLGKRLNIKKPDETIKFQVWPMPTYYQSPQPIFGTLVDLTPF